MSRRVAARRQPQPDPVLAAADVVDQQLIGPLSFATTTSVSPSLSISPNAAPRPTSGSLQDRAGLSGDVLKLPVAEIAEQLLGLLQRKRFVPRERFGLCLTAPLTVRISSQPSLSKSNQAAPKPV